MKKLIVVLLIFFISGCTNKTYMLDNNYYLLEKSNDSYLYTKKENKYIKTKVNIPIESYTKVDNLYIFRCLNKDNGINIIYYTLDIGKSVILGPYNSLNELDILFPSIKNNKWYSVEDLYK